MNWTNIKYKFYFVLNINYMLKCSKSMVLGPSKQLDLLRMSEACILCSPRYLLENLR